jgi:AGCS family alanine or glycine:cation symporter
MGALFELEIVWNFSDAMNALMAVPNLIGLLLLSRILSRETRSFNEGINKGTINKFD